MDKSVTKAFQLLEILSKSEKPMGVTALSKMSSLGKSNVHRLLQTLQDLKYVCKNEGGTYQASLRMWEMGSHVFSRLELRDIARPHMKNLSQVTSETVHLSELDGYEVLYVDKIESREPVRAYTQLGGRAPAYCTATGKIMLTYLDPDQIVECYRDVHQHTEKTITIAGRFNDEILRNRQRRYAINRGEWRSDIVGIAAPIVGHIGKVVGAIGLSAPAHRIDIDKLETLAPQLVEHAKYISISLGCSKETWEMLGSKLPATSQTNIA